MYVTSACRHSAASVLVCRSERCSASSTMRGSSASRWISTPSTRGSGCAPAEAAAAPPPARAPSFSVAEASAAVLSRAEALLGEPLVAACCGLLCASRDGRSAR